MKCSIIIIGEYAVGKTTLLRTYKDSKFHENPLPTLGVEYYEIKREDSDNSYKVIIFSF
jgi:GTPase SAR1 family protein